MDPIHPDGPGAHPIQRRSMLSGLAGGLLAGMLSPATAVAVAADQALDVRMLQTSASIENVLVGTYDTLLGLPALGSPANATLRTLLSTARDHHADHAQACNELAGQLGGRPQTSPNAALSELVSETRARFSDLAAVVALAVQLEAASAQTYQNNVPAFADANGRRLSASILGVEAQHLAVLQVARVLVEGRTPELINLETGNGARLPPAVGMAAFPDSFAKVDQARPADEGAVE